MNLRRGRLAFLNRHRSRRIEELERVEVRNGSRRAGELKGNCRRGVLGWRSKVAVLSIINKSFGAKSTQPEREMCSLKISRLKETGASSQNMCQCSFP